VTNLITLTNISLAYGLDPLLDKSSLQIATGERVCLIGRNGAGKSSLLKIIDGTQLPDSGTIWRKPELRIARLAQELPRDAVTTVYEFVADGLAETGKLLKAYHALTIKLAEEHAPSPDEAKNTAAGLQKLEQLQDEIDAKNGWRFEQEINTILTRLELDPDAKVAALSGGWQRRAALAQALVVSPDLLLLDEPTNHLDIEAIQWLEEFLLNCNIGIIFITHDRSLLQRLATRIIELDRGNLTSWPGDYENFLRRKEEMLHAEDKQNADFDKRLVQEEKWVRQGVKARRTRNEGRVRALEQMRHERSLRREQQGKASFAVDDATKSGQLVVEVNNISHYFADKCVIKNFSLRIMRGDRLGLIGPNGIGKSTLLNILLEKLVPQQGEVKPGSRLEVAYFDQLRAALDPEKTVAENVTQGSDTIEVNGQKRHIISYLGDFLFTPQRARTPVKALSGGECNRLLLAKLFSKPANLLVMDEPTNDLDIETLELLEAVLANFTGTLLLVSHDRQFVDNVVTSTLVFEGEGKIQEYIGGYQDWLRQRIAGEKAPSRGFIVSDTSTVDPVGSTSSASRPKKLSYKEQQELKSLPQKIEQLEAALVALQEQMAGPQFYQQPADVIATATARLQAIPAELEAAYHRWHELEG
jgi:ATP-binding cassette subfamily F protein uup